MKNQKQIVRILALVMAVLLALSLIVSVVPVRSRAEGPELPENSFQQIIGSSFTVE